MRLDGSNVCDWQHTGVHPRYGVRLESATLATHVYVPAHMIAATDAARTAPVGGRGGGEPVDHPPVQAPVPATNSGSALMQGDSDTPVESPIAPGVRSGNPPALHAAGTTPHRASSDADERPTPNHPGARASDPTTSHLAAAAVTEQARRDIHRQVLAILAEGPASDFDLAARTGLKQTSVGCRRAELRDNGLVRQLDRNGVSDTGSACIRWELTDAGWAAA